MPRFTTLFALLSSVLALTSARSPPTDSINITHSLTPRWYSLPGPTRFGDVGTWPVIGRDPTEGNIQPIRYCYGDGFTAWTTSTLVHAAIEYWRHAADQSAFDIILDPGCEGNYWCLCSSLEQPSDALHIYNAGVDNTQDSGSTLGYQYNSDLSGRHRMDIRNFDSSDVENFIKGVVGVTHEFGHVAGLAHEHQHPNRDASLVFNCFNLEGYEQATEDIKDNLPFMPFCWSGCDAMHGPSNSGSSVIGLQYFPALVDYVVGNRIAKFSGYYSSPEWDRWSIMNYNSYGGDAANHGTFPDGAVLVGRGQNGEPDFEVFQGGFADKAQAMPSEGDVERIKELYPY
ncbi:hypothetical protein LTR17_010262 [Elasticomyces elasticus]|nr:hypothetical protein LTR17_010262 [Elasticomyces elasticus]